MSSSRKVVLFTLCFIWACFGVMVDAGHGGKHGHGGSGLETLLAAGILAKLLRHHGGGGGGGGHKHHHHHGHHHHGHHHHEHHGHEHGHKERSAYGVGETFPMPVYGFGYDHMPYMPY